MAFRTSIQAPSTPGTSVSRFSIDIDRSAKSGNFALNLEVSRVTFLVLATADIGKGQQDPFKRPHQACLPSRSAYATNSIFLVCVVPACHCIVSLSMYILR